MTDAPPLGWFSMLSTPRARRVGLAAGVLLLAGAASTLIIATGPDGAAQPQVEKATPVSVVRASPAELHPMFATYGRVEARTQTELRATVRSTVEDVLVREGQWVKEGDLLIRLDDDEIQLQLREAQAEENQQKAVLESIERELSVLQKNSTQFETLFELSQDKLERQRKLANLKMIPQSLFDDAIEQAARDTLEYQIHLSALTDLPNRIIQQRAQLEIAGVKVEQAQLDLAKTEIKAPFSGPVLAVDANVGNITQVGAALATIADADSFEIRAAVPDQYARRIRHHLGIGNPITASTDPQNHSGYRVRLSRVTRSVRAGQGSLDAFFTFAADQHQDGLPDLGRVVNLNAILPTEPGLVALPTQAIYENNRVYTVQNNRLQAASIERVGEFKEPDGSYKVLVRGQALTSASDVVITQLPKAITGLLVAPITPVDTPPDSTPILRPAETPVGSPTESPATEAVVGRCDQAPSEIAAFSGCTTTQGLTTIVQSRASLSCHNAACASLT